MAELECEDGLVEELLVDHLVEGGYDAVNGDAVKCEAEDAIKLSECESEAGLRGRLCKVLMLYDEVSDAESVLGDEPLHCAGSILDLEYCAVLLVG